MLLKVFTNLVIVIAVMIGILALTLQEQLVRLVIFRDFFDIALPVLGFGALIKYLVIPARCENCRSKEKNHQQFS